MNEISIFKENFISMVMMLGKLPDGKLFKLPSGSIASISGIPSEDDNYAIFNPTTSEKEMDDILNIFKEHKMPFIAPELYNDKKSETLTKMLDSSGLKKKHIYTAMSLDKDNKKPNHISRGSLLRMTSRKDARDWATASWLGFGEKLPVAENYVVFSEQLMSCGKNELYVFKEDDIIVSSGLTHNSESCAGLYYFSTVPKYRRRGFAHRLMDGMAHEALSNYKYYVLLATAEGLPFYKNYGFNALYSVPIRALSQI